MKKGSSIQIMWKISNIFTCFIKQSLPTRLALKVKKMLLYPNNLENVYILIYNLHSTLQVRINVLPSGLRCPSGIPATVWMFVGGKGTSVLRSFIKLVFDVTGVNVSVTRTHSEFNNVLIFDYIVVKKATTLKTVNNNSPPNKKCVLPIISKTNWA